MIETRLLQYFLAVAEEQSVTRAAESLHISQPTLSKQMMDLEAELGKQLFIRGKKKITLTEDGAFLRLKAQEIVSLIDKTESAFRETVRTVTGDVCVGCGEFKSVLPVMEIIKDLRLDFPGIKFHVFSGSSEAVLERLERDLIDMGFLIEQDLGTRYEVKALPFRETLGILTPKNGKFSGADSVSLEQLSGEPMIMPAKILGSKRVKALFSGHGFTPCTAATYDLIYNASLMVKAGIGHALCVDGLMTTDECTLKFIKLTPEFQSGVYLVKKKNRVCSKAADLFYSRLCERLGF